MASSLASPLGHAWVYDMSVLPLLAALSLIAPLQRSEPVDYINPLVGTAVTGFGPGLEGGGSLPTIGSPFAMTNFVPQTHENKISQTPYNYEATTICGFLATHQPALWMGDYGYVSVMPQVGELKVLPQGRSMPFDHADEVVKPYFYSVRLKTSKTDFIKAEMSARSRCGILRFTYPSSQSARLIIHGINLNPALSDWANDFQPRLKTLKGYVHIDATKGEITGYNPDRQSAQLGPDLPNFRGYFVIQCDQPFESFGTWSDDKVFANRDEQAGTRIGGYVNFHLGTLRQVKVKIATSFISLDQARENLKREIPRWKLETVAQRTKTEWSKAISRFEVEGATEAQKENLYSALYHCFQYPREFSEYGHYYSAFDDKIHEGDAYSDYSLWDTFRALHPLLHLLQPERVNPMIRALLNEYKEGGWLPKWPNPTYTNIMIGTHADSVIADAYLKGFRGYDVNLAYEAIRKDSMVAPEKDEKRWWGDRDRWVAYEARGGLSYYRKLGFVPIDKTAEAVSRTIEYSYNDYCVAQMAKALGKVQDYEFLSKESLAYKNLYNPTTRFFAPKRADGSWNQDPNVGFTEGSNWTYLFGALHDIPGMIQLMGGTDAFVKRLDQNFEEGHYRHDNEPGHHYAYLYDYCGQPWKTQALVRKHTRENFRNTPIGENGNDDCGQMSAWYIFSMIGFYPICPSNAEFAIGAPQLPKVTLRLGSGRREHSFEIVANGLSEENLYIQSASLDGVKLTRPVITYSQIMSGRRLVFEMGPSPKPF